MRAAALAVGAALALGAAAPGRAQPPQVAWQLHCQGCHRADGTGKPGAVPSLAGRVALYAGTPAGRAFLVGVPGSAQSPLSDGELAAVLNWMVGRFGPAGAAAAARPFDAGEVRRLRTPLDDPAAARRALLRELGLADAAASAAGP